MKGLIKDLSMAAQVFGKAREARKQGAELRVQKTVGLPLLKQTDWAALLEGTLFHDKEMDAAVRAVFYRLNAETRRYLILFMPDTPCGWLERARFWSEILRLALPPKMYHEAMIRLCSWYRHCIDLRKENTRWTLRS